MRTKIGKLEGLNSNGKPYKRQKLDAVATNWMGKAGRTKLGLDATIGSALLHSKVAKAARIDGHVTATLEEEKAKLK